MGEKRGLFIILLLSAILVLAFSSLALAGSAVQEQQEQWQNRKLQESRQLRLQECEEPCAYDCEPQLNRLEKHEQLHKQLHKQVNEKKEVFRQQRNGTRR